MSDFLQRLQARLKANQVAQPGRAQRSALDQKTLASSSRYSPGLAMQIKPTSVSHSLTYLLMLVTAVLATYWGMRIAQIPGLPSQGSNQGTSQGVNKGMTLYSNQDGASAYDLFGSKPISTDRIYLRGVVVTSKNKDGVLDGYAIFEMDGKPTNAMSIGESLGKGLSLQSIGVESATLLYQGQKLDFKLSRPGADKNNSSSKK